nr:TRAV5.3 [Sphenodon punctatus]
MKVHSSQLSHKGKMHPLGIWISIVLLTIPAEVSGQDSVSQKDQIASAKEGEPIQLECSYTGNPDNLQWYKQLPDGEIQFMAILFSSKTESHGHFDMSLDKNARNTSIVLKSTQLDDSAVYFCALDLQKSEPSVYELESTNKSHPLSACLFTDYFPGNINVSATGSNLVGIESSVVVVEDQASYGAVLWQNANENLQCIANYDGEDIQAKKDIADSCSGTQMSFQTDERLNLLSLTVLGLRVIFFKSVAVNLLLTFRLWSR